MTTEPHTFRPAWAGTATAEMLSAPLLDRHLPLLERAQGPETYREVAMNRMEQTCSCQVWDRFRDGTPHQVWRLALF